MKWSICVLTVPSRKPLFDRLMRILEPQLTDDVELIIAKGPESISQKRQACLDSAEGEYISFIDDDDIIPHNYVETILPLLDGVDYIGFQLQLYIDGVKQKPTYHSLEYTEWWDDHNGYYRDVSHLNPIRTEIARQGRFDGGYGEDRRWADMVKPKTEHYIDQVMYRYFYSSTNSLSRC